MSRLSVALLPLLSACTAPLSSATVEAPEHCGPLTEVLDEGAAPLRSPPAPAGLIYEIYVRSYQDSDGDGVGDLNGVRQRLDHLASLGVGTLWLMPVFQASGVAGYGVTDYDTLAEEYGTPEQLRALVEEAHALDMAVILDIPFNHVDRTHPWFTSAEGDIASPQRSWFRFDDEDVGDGRWFPSEQRGYYYGFFGADLPDLNYDNPDVAAEMARVFDAWLDAGADGYRLDAVRMLVEQDGVAEGTDASHALLAELLASARSAHPDAWFLAEASETTALGNVCWLGSDGAPEADAVLDFPRRDAMLDAVETGDLSGLIDVVNTEVKLGGGAAMASFLGSHDVDRLPDVVEDPRARRALRVAQFLMPGAPVLYYGEEIDMANSTVDTGQDYEQRGPMQWDTGNNAGFTPTIPWFTVDPSFNENTSVAVQQEERDSPLKLIQDLSCVRVQHGLDLDNTWRPVQASGASTLSFIRDTEDGALLVVVNLSDRIEGDLQIEASGSFQDLATGEAVEGEGLLDLGVLGPWGYRVLSGASLGPCSLWDGSGA